MAICRTIQPLSECSRESHPTIQKPLHQRIMCNRKNWPLQLWDQLTHQATITLNLLCTSRIDPTKSTYEQIPGAKYNWNKHPMAPPGTRAIVYEAPDSRASWGPRGIDAWYCGPELDHYRNCKFMCPKHAHIALLVHLTYFRNIAHCLSSHPSNMPMKYTTSSLMPSKS